MNCPKRNREASPNGYVYDRHLYAVDKKAKRKKRYRCNSCKLTFYDDAEQQRLAEKRIRSQIRKLIWDYRIKYWPYYDPSKPIFIVKTDLADQVTSDVLS